MSDCSNKKDELIISRAMELVREALEKMAKEAAAEEGKKQGKEDDDDQQRAGPGRTKARL
jgi:hypothetical protein